MSLNGRRIVDMAAQNIDAGREAIRKSLAGPPPPGLEPPSDAEFAEFVASQVRVHPIEPWVKPDGTVVLVSPWIAMLDPELEKPVDGGEVVLRRVERVMGGIKPGE